MNESGTNTTKRKAGRPLTDTERRARLLAQREALEAEMRERSRQLREEVEALDRVIAAKEAKHRKVREAVVGRLIYEHLDLVGGEDRLLKLLEQYVSSTRERVAFGWSPLAGAAAEEGEEDGALNASDCRYR